MRTFRLREFESRRPCSPSPPVRPCRTIKGRDRVGRKRLSWQTSPESTVERHRIYWKVGGRVGYDSHFAEVGGLTALVLPDDVPSFPLVTGQMEIGVTAIGCGGNESDMVVLSAFLDFGRPAAPSKVELADWETGTW